MIARTVRLDADIDLLAVAGANGFLFEEHGAGLAGAGVAARIPVAEAEERLAAIVTEDEVGLPGCGPVAFAALPFTLTPDAELVVPEVVVGRTADGTRWVTTIGAMGAPTPEITSTAVAPRPGWAADARITSSRDPADWQAVVVTARDKIRAGALDKVVLARELHIEMSEEIDVGGVLARLRSSFPSSFVYSVDGMIGASPELLVSRSGDVVRSHPLAGTAPRSGDPAVDARIANALGGVDEGPTRAPPDHRHGARHSAAVVLLPRRGGGTLDRRGCQRPAPRDARRRPVVQAAAVRAGPRARTPSHPGRWWPSPRRRARPHRRARGARSRALCGTRRVGRRQRQRTVGRRAAVRARSMARQPRLYAGVGVVRDSDPDAELAETQAKFAAMLGAVLRP